MNDAAPEFPSSCPRCELPSAREGEVWCCRDLIWLRAAMAGPNPPSMDELLRTRFIGRTAKSIDNACRRYGFKTPVRTKRRRPRCEVCAGLFDGPDKCCAVCAAPCEERNAA